MTRPQQRLLETKGTDAPNTRKTRIRPRSNISECDRKTIYAGLGDEKGRVFEILWGEWLRLKTTFNDLKLGFGGDDPPMMQVRAVAAAFGDRCQDLHIEAVVMGTCRLTDRVNPGRSDDVSIGVLPGWFSDMPDKEDKACALVCAADNAARRGLRHWRNKQLAHLTSAKTRPEVIGDDVENAVDAIHAALDFVWTEEIKHKPQLPQEISSAMLLSSHLLTAHRAVIDFETTLLKAAEYQKNDETETKEDAIRRLIGRELPRDGVRGALKRALAGQTFDQTNPDESINAVATFISAVDDAQEAQEKAQKMREDIERSAKSVQKDTPATSAPKRVAGGPRPGAPTKGPRTR